MGVRPYSLFVGAVSVAVLAAAPPAAGADREAKHLHALLVLDTHAERAEELGVAVDGRRVLDLLETAFQVRTGGNRAGRVTITVLTGRDVTKEAIKAYFDDLPRDLRSAAVLFYYSGHGGSIPVDQIDDNLNVFNWHGTSFFATRHGGVIRRTEIREWLKPRDPMLTVILSDCCSNHGKTELAVKAAKGEGPAFRNPAPPRRPRADPTPRSPRGATAGRRPPGDPGRSWARWKVSGSRRCAGNRSAGCSSSTKESWT